MITINNLAVLIACEKYDNFIDKNLIGLNKDIESLKEVLTSNCSCSEDFVYECTCSQTSKYHPDYSFNIDSMLTEIIEITKNSTTTFDVGFLYYGGHGINRKGEPHLIFQSACLETFDDPNSFKSIHDIIKILRQLKKVKQWVVFLDMCQLEVENPNGTNPIYSFNNTVYISSCESGREAFMRKNEKGSVFAHCLVEALSIRNSCVTVRQVFTKICSSIDTISEKEKRKHQKPQIHLANACDPLLELVITNNFLGDNDYYKKTFETELFLEQRYGVSETAKLGDVYIEPLLEHFKGHNSIILEEDYTGDDGIKYDDLISWCFSNDTNNKLKNNVILLLGKAGVGKTSLVCDIVKKFQSNLFDCSIRVVTLQLRKYAEYFSQIQITSDKSSSIKCNFYIEDVNDYEEWGMDEFTSLELVNRLISNMIVDFENTLIVLDGIDEISVLAPEFDVKKFIEDLISDVNDKNIKILVTSREGYFDYDNILGLLKIELKWDDSCVEKWCEKYSLVQSQRKQWCSQFPEKFKKYENERIKNIISCPIILYMMCVSYIDLDNNISRARIYGEVFSNVGHRNHNIDNYFDENDSYENYRMMIKEISFIVSNNNNSSSLDVQSDVIKKVEKKFLNGKFNFIKEKLKFFGMFHFASGDNSKKYAFQVAHRTVFEYFSAFKICEDFFEITKDYAEFFDNAQESWNRLFRAFRYSALEPSIFDFIVDIIKCNKKYDNYRDWLCSLFCETVSDEHYLESALLSPEYETKKLKVDQIDIAFSNTFTLLEEFDFYKWTKEKVESGQKNILSKNIEYIKYLFNHFSIYNPIYIKPQILYLEGVDFGIGDMGGANMSLAKLNNADFRQSVLHNVSLSNSELSGAFISIIHDSDLSGAVLYKLRVEQKVYFNGCQLSEAILEGNDLEYFEFSGCDMNYIHITKEQLEYVKKIADENGIDYVYIDGNPEAESIYEI